jgi:hypothetical protein
MDFAPPTKVTAEEAAKESEHWRKDALNLGIDCSNEHDWGTPW